MNDEQKAELQEMLDSIDIGDFLDREGITYKPTMGSRGPQFNIRECPVCGNDQWKVFLNRESGLGNCFAGRHPQEKRGFNKWSFIRGTMGGEEAHPAAVVERVRGLARELGWRKRRVAAVATTTERGSPMLPKHLDLPIKGKNLAYLENRGIDLELVRYFGWKFCMKGWHAYLDERGESHFQLFEKRVLIPVYDLDGVLVSFQGRDVTGTAERKYLFPIGFAVTGEHVYNGQNFMPGTRRAVVGEGVFDVAATKLALDRDPALRDVIELGTFGKHLSYGSPQSQLEKFRRLKDERGLEEVTIMWDGEIQATDDAIAAGELLKGIGLKVRIAMLPPEKDPNEVAPDVVRDAFYRATVLTPLTGQSLRLQRRQMNTARTTASA